MSFQQNTAQQQTLSSRTPQAEGSPSAREISRFARNDSEVANQNDRLAPMLKFANELGKIQLLENKKRRQQQWTPQKRAEQARKVKKLQPWKRSTGPKTQAGKAAASQNAWKHGTYGADMKEFRRLLRRQKQFVDMVELAMRLRRKNRTIQEIHATTADMTRLEDTYHHITGRFTAAFEDPKREAKCLIREVIGLEEADFITVPGKELTPAQQQAIEAAVQRRLEGEPLSRIVGRREFWGMEFEVTPDTLDPRPDTETLVEAALKWAKRHPKNQPEELQIPPSYPPAETPFLKRGLCNDLPDSIGSASSAGLQHRKDKPFRILDLGTGTGCIPIALLSELPNASAVAVDYSPEAVRVVQKNAENHKMSNRLSVIQGNWFEGLEEESFDLIVSNPPYVVESEIENLAAEVKNHDPILALSGGDDGLNCYKKIIFGLKKHLNHSNRAFLEIGVDQLESITGLVEESGLCLTDSHADIAGIPRVVEICRGDK